MIVKAPAACDASSRLHVYGSLCSHILGVAQAKAAKLPNRALLDEYWLQGAALEAGCLPKPALLLDLNDPNMTFEMRQGHDTAELANAPATILPALPNVLPPLHSLTPSSQHLHMLMLVASITKWACLLQQYITLRWYIKGELACVQHMFHLGSFLMACAV